MKSKITVIIAILMLILLTTASVYATENEITASSPTELVTIKESTNDKLEEYADKYEFDDNFGYMENSNYINIISISYELTYNDLSLILYLK